MRRIYVAILIMLLPIAAMAEKLPYKNPKLSPEERTRDLISRMTLDEKIAQMQCEWLMGKVRVKH